MRQHPTVPESPPRQQLPHAAGLPHLEGNHHGFGVPAPNPSPTALPPQQGSYQSEHRHEQQNDPNFAQINTHKTQGYCVLKPPGGGSSIDLGWNVDNNQQVRPAPAEPRGYACQDRVPRESAPSMAQNPPSRASPSYHHEQGIRDPYPAQHVSPPTTTPHNIPSSHEPQQGYNNGNMHRESVHRVNSSPYAWDGQTETERQDDRRGGHNAVSAPAKYGAATAGAASRAPTTGNNIFGGADSAHGEAAPRVHNMAHNMAHGVRQNPESANRFAVGSSQNVGNCITGRSTTRVAAPPGGFSNFTLG